VEGSDEGDSAVEGSEEHFDESEHVDGFAEEERSTDGEDGSGEEVDESEGEGCRGPEGSDLVAEEEEGYEEGGPNAEEGYEDLWDEVQEALSTMRHEEYDEAVLCTRYTKVSSVATLFISFVPSVSAVLGCV
jgi:hypothetical protein